MSVFNVWHYLICPFWIRACSELLWYEFKITSLPSTELFWIYVNLNVTELGHWSGILSLSLWLSAWWTWKLVLHKDFFKVCSALNCQYSIQYQKSLMIIDWNGLCENNDQESISSLSYLIFTLPFDYFACTTVLPLPSHRMQHLLSLLRSSESWLVKLWFSISLCFYKTPSLNSNKQ